jgi:hypothetical protein
LKLPISGSKDFDCGFWPKNTSVIGNKPIQSFFGNKFFLHDVNYIAGHR